MKKSVLKKPSDIKDVFGAFLVENAQFSKGKYDMPVVRSNIDELPTSLFSYQKVGKKKLELQPKTALHCSGVPRQVILRYQALLPARLIFFPASASIRSTNAWQS